MNIQPILKNELVKLIPLQPDDFEDLYQVASDPLIWEQHPNKDRYQKDIFSTFFEGALLSKGALLIIDQKSGEIAGCTRYYDYDAVENSIFIGYTFYAKKFWGSKLNPLTKRLMLDYILDYVEIVKFHVGIHNVRSQKAMEKLGAVKRKEIEVAYFGETPKINIEYWITKSNWIKHT